MQAMQTINIGQLRRPTDQSDCPVRAMLEREASQILTRDGLAPYHSGLCAALAIYLWLKIPDDHRHQASLRVLYRLECDNTTDEELHRVISHVMLCYQGDSFDLKGWGADARWEKCVVDTIEPWNDNCYNKVEYDEVCSVPALMRLVEPYNMRMMMANGEPVHEAPAQ